MERTEGEEQLADAEDDEPQTDEEHYTVGDVVAPHQVGVLNNV